MQLGCCCNTKCAPAKIKPAATTEATQTTATPTTTSATSGTTATPAHISTPAKKPEMCPTHMQPADKKAPQAKVMPTPEPQAMLNLPTDATPQVVDLWQPNEAQLARGNELILGLQEEIHRNPTAHEMQKRLQTHMGLSPTQAQKVVAALGHKQD